MRLCQALHDTGSELHACIGGMIDLWVESDRAIGTTPPGPLGLVLCQKHRKFITEMDVYPPQNLQEMLMQHVGRRTFYRSA